MKKLLTILLIAAMAASMTACTKHTTPTASSEITSSSVSEVSSSSDSSSISSSSAVSSPSTATSNTASKVDSAATSSKSSGSKVSTTVSTPKNTTGGHSSTQTPASTTRGGSGSPNTTTTTKPSNNSTAPAAPTSSYKLVMPTQSQLNDLSNRVLCLINAERVRCGASALRTESKLTQAAQIRATECSKNFPTYNGHMRPDGTLYATILSEVQYGTRQERQASTDGENWYTQVYYDSGAGTENLVSWWCDPTNRPSGFRSTSAELNEAAQKIFTDWKNSSGHYRNMISKTFTATGVGCKAVIINESMSIQCIQIFTEK